MEQRRSSDLNDDGLPLPGSETTMAQAFISYASEDSIFADLVRMKLRDAGIDVWIDERQLRAGEEWRKAIDEGITSSGVVVVILTPASSKSYYGEGRSIYEPAAA